MTRRPIDPANWIVVAAFVVIFAIMGFGALAGKAIGWLMFFLHAFL